MKKLLAIAATLAASSAFAGVKLEVRSDYVNTPNYDNNSGTEMSGSSVFTPSVARLYLNGNVGDAIIDSGWNLRSFAPEVAVNPVNGSQDIYKNMTVDQFVDHLWAGKAMGNWMFKAGKLQVNMGGFEHQKEIHGDTYLTSMANGGQGGTIQVNTPGAGTTDSISVPAVGYVTTPANVSGVSAAYTITPEHKVEVQVTNQTNAQTASGYNAPAPGSLPSYDEKSLDRRHTMGVAYFGSVLDKMIEISASYTSGAADTTVAGHEQEFIAAGVRVAPMANLTFDVEYFGNKDKASAGNTSYELKTTSTVLEARYSIDGWTPLAKYEMSENKDSDNKKLGDWKREAWAVGLEYAPKADEAFRYHIAYTSVKDKDFASPTAKALSANDDMTKNMIVVGFKYMGDMAK